MRPNPSLQPLIHAVPMAQTSKEGLIVTKSVTLDDKNVAELSCFSVEWYFVDYLFFCGAVFGQPLAAD